jgi:hypothetical protein
MPTETYTALATVTLGSSASSVTFSSIPASYRDLVLVYNGTGTSGQSLQPRFNNDTGGNYTTVRMYNSGGGSSPASDNYAPAEIGYNNTTNTGIANIMDYSATDKHKTYLTRWGNADGTSYVQAYAARWANTAAITSIQITNSGGGNIAAGSTFNLYGIAS